MELLSSMDMVSNLQYYRDHSNNIKIRLQRRLLKAAEGHLRLMCRQCCSQILRQGQTRLGNTQPQEKVLLMILYWNKMGLVLEFQ